MDELTVFDDGYRPSEDATLADTVTPPTTPFIQLVETVSYPERRRSDLRDRTAPIALPWDLDADGDDEVLLLDGGGLSVVNMRPSGESELRALLEFVPERLRLSMAAVDFDADGVDELAVVSDLNGRAELEIYEVSPTQARRTESVMVADEIVQGDLAVGVVDLDRNGDVEIYVADTTGPWFRDRTIFLHRYRFESGTWTEHDTLSLQACADENRRVSMVAAPFTSDGQPYVVTAINCDSSYRLLAVGDFDDHTFYPGLAAAVEQSRVDNINHQPRPAIALARADPRSDDGAQLVVVSNRRERQTPTVRIAAEVRIFSPPVAENRGWSPRVPVFETDGLSTLGPPSVITGDVDLDGLDEVIVSMQTNEGNVVFAGDISQDCGFECRPFSQIAMHGQGRGPLNHRNVVALADLDGDSLKARATGEVIRWTGEPHVNAVLAAPPTWDGTDGIEHDGSTAFGVADTSGASASRQITSSASSTVSFEAGFFDVVSVRASQTLAEAYSRGSNQQSSVTTGVEVTSGPRSDLVYYTLTTYASHIYEAVAHPDSALRGRTFSVDAPARSYAATQGLVSFRRQFADIADQLVPPDLFGHRLGNPFSYRRAEYCNALGLDSASGRATEIFSSQLVDVGNSDSGSASLTVGFAEQTGTTTELTLGVELSGGLSLGGAGLDVTMGLETSTTHETFVGSEVTYRGEVRNLPDRFYTMQRRYLWGLCVYHYLGSEGRAAYPVVDYVVEPIDRS
ncbi:MAG: VCBS repeat-containing protein [Myxococcota bacterium]